MTEAQIKELKEIVKHQAEMETLWGIPLERPLTFQEAMLMAALRHLHSVVENDELGVKLAKKVYWNLESEM